MPMLTRKAAAQEMASKLSTALKELKACKNQCQQLLQEREDSETEIKEIVDKNTNLKGKLAELLQQYLTVVDERDKLQEEKDGFSQCSYLYEGALRKVRDLEQELHSLNSELLKLKQEKESAQAVNTLNLYNELITHDPLPIKCLITTDLTEQDTLIKNNFFKMSSHKKIKKYIKLSKIIMKCNKLKKQNKLFSKTTQLRKEKIYLIKKLSNCHIKLEDSKNIYEMDTQRLQSDIRILEESFNSLYSKYVISQKQIEEHILAANSLVDMCTYNADRVDSLTLNNTPCSCISKSNKSNIQITEDQSQGVDKCPCPEVQKISMQNLSQTVFNV